MTLSALNADVIVDQLNAGEVTATDCVQHFLDRIQIHNAELNAFIRVSESALEQAEAIDQRRKSGESLGSLAGLPIAIKDGICVSGQPTTAGSKMLENFSPPYDATIVERLKSADAIIIGKTNMDEFAMGSSTENSFFGPTNNPWATNRVPGGSSGGSAACVAARLAPVAIGSDTGGSIRQPASFCGITGLKPTYGRVSRYGLIAFASSLDQIGPMTRTAKESALLMSVIAGFDPRDSTSSKEQVSDFLTGLETPLAGLRIGVCRDHLNEGLDVEVKTKINDAISVFKQLGANIEEIELPQTKSAIAAYYIIAPCEASSNLARYDGVRYTFRAQANDLEEMYRNTRGQGFGDEVKQRIMLGTYALSSGYYEAYYLKASKVRRMIKQDYDEAFKKVDLILGPTTPTPAFKLGQHTQDPLAMYLADIYTVSANLAGIPAISVPVEPSSTGLPIGLQLQGRAFEENTLLRAAHQFQNETLWHTASPSEPWRTQS
ncbi:MAG: Asp-tRNA(Asn)/Glu-tRNA(Gln) amidotransferase subunit GatA [Planctomycetaceae bacterium]|nr:Asp-tRNA(Asn)/Glu-tRNA(Gln) amidotransferase subunit GatA [Planctomycetaceae bacterium]MCP4478069.1 Asp-tRNA(Asn)/Glu-tRNA(Gln) amidotransferase subunit GatA [Planctomycetaceae bacterium]